MPFGNHLGFTRRARRVAMRALAWVFFIAGCAVASEEQRVIEKIESTPPPALNPALPTLWIAGDSTAANGNPDATGWGKPLAGFFDLTTVNVANRYSRL